MNRYTSILGLTVALLSSCEGFLDEKPDKVLAVPTDKLENLQLLLDHTNVMNANYPSAGELASDNAFLTSENWNALSTVTERNLYIWDRDVFNDGDRNDWTLPYEILLYANLVLEGTEAIESTENNKDEWDNVRGSALFFRAHVFHRLMQEFASPYDFATAQHDPGVALRLSSDINEKSTRASVQECYDRIISDLKEAVRLLPEMPEYKTRPSKSAAYAMLARTFLSMRDYEQALPYADSALNIHNRVIDYNSLDTTLRYSFLRFNEEVIFHCWMVNRPGLIDPNGRIDTTLYHMYSDTDLRKQVFFTYNGPTDISFDGSYDGTLLLFSGIAVDEVYLTRAECLARTGNVSDAMNDLNLLLAKRHLRDTFVPFQAATAEEALEIILRERRKELIFRGLRWMDLRRLNKEPAHGKILRRVIDGRTFELTPDDKRYILPIPQKVIDATGMQQNE